MILALEQLPTNDATIAIIIVTENSQIKRWMKNNIQCNFKMTIQISERLRMFTEWAGFVSLYQQISDQTREQIFKNSSTN